MISLERNYESDEVLSKYKNVEDKKNAFVIFGEGLGIGSIEEILDEKYGIFRIKDGKIEREEMTPEKIKELNEKSCVDDVLWIVSQRYMSSTDDQSNRLLLLVQPRLKKPGENMQPKTNGDVV